MFHRSSMDLDPKPTPALQSSSGGKKLPSGHTVGKLLGSGAFAVVHRGRDSSGREVAIKFLTSRSASLNKDEQTALYTLDHPNILELYSTISGFSFQLDAHKWSSEALVLELARGGELFDFLTSTGSMNERIARTYFKQIIDAVDYCHQRGIAHRDLKPENLLLDENFNLKIADFGICKILTTPDHKTTTGVGTPRYRAPEVALGDYDPCAADIWSCGVILFIMLTLYPPFGDVQSKCPLFKAVERCDFATFWQLWADWAHFSLAAQDLLNKIFSVDPKNRISIASIKRHPWYKGPTASPDALKAEGMAKRKLFSQRPSSTRKQMSSDSSSGGDSSDGVFRGAASGGSDVSATIPDYHFAISEDEEPIPLPSPDADARPAPLPKPESGAVRAYSVFESKSSPKELLEKVTRLLHAGTGSIVRYDASSFTMEGQVETFSGVIGLGVQVFADPDPKSQLSHLQLRRVCGDSIVFHRLCDGMMRGMSDLLTTSSVVSSSAKSASCGPYSAARASTSSSPAAAAAAAAADLAASAVSDLDFSDEAIEPLI